MLTHPEDAGAGKGFPVLSSLPVLLGVMLVCLLIYKDLNSTHLPSLRSLKEFVFLGCGCGGTLLQSQHRGG